jgi:hypothetical protein
MKKLIVSTISAFTVFSACADDIKVGMNIGTYHFNNPADYSVSMRSYNIDTGKITRRVIYESDIPVNNNNPGLYFIKDGWSVGFYKNSEFNTSYHAGYTFYKVFGGPIDITTGVVTGYTRYNVAPVLMPSFKIGYVRIGFLLPIKDIIPGITFAIEQ